jgi:hypothetical protein
VGLIQSGQIYKRSWRLEIITEIMRSSVETEINVGKMVGLRLVDLVDLVDSVDFCEDG